METKEKPKYIPLKDLDVYIAARDLSREAWILYEKMSWQQKKILGDQFIESTDSVGANIAEGYSRYHYLDKVKFYYIARGSLAEAMHWMELLDERKLATKAQLDAFMVCGRKTSIKLQSFISAQYESKSRTSNPNFAKQVSTSFARSASFNPKK